MTKDAFEKVVNNVNKLKLRVDALRTFAPSSQQVGLVCGTFDLFHDGHRSFINGAAKQCDFLIAMVNSDQRVKRKKGENRPIWGQEQRALEVAKISDIHAVFAPEQISALNLFNRASFSLINLVLRIKPDIIFIGSDDNFPIASAIANASNYVPSMMQITDGACHTHTSDLLKQKNTHLRR